MLALRQRGPTLMVVGTTVPWKMLFCGNPAIQHIKSQCCGAYATALTPGKGWSGWELI